MIIRRMTFEDIEKLREIRAKNFAHAFVGG